MTEKTREEAPGKTLEAVLEDPVGNRPEVADEIQALQAIFGDSNVQVRDISQPISSKSTIRLVLNTTLPCHDDVEVAFLISLPPTYPDSSPPQLQLLSRYVGDFATDSSLFGAITRTFLRDDIWLEGSVAVFEGIERAREQCDAYLISKLADIDEKKITDFHSTQDDLEIARHLQYEEEIIQAESQLRTVKLEEAKLPEGCKLFTSDPITDRKSVFIGHACRIKSPAEVSQVVDFLLSDRKIAKAAHPAMLAYRYRGSGDIVHQDNDDDGETAAGSRLAHLLQILDLHDVLVIVTRWYGGIHLGSDRFKHINQAARDALVVGGFVKPSNKK